MEINLRLRVARHCQTTQVECVMPCCVYYIYMPPFIRDLERDEREIQMLSRQEKNFLRMGLGRGGGEGVGDLIETRGRKQKKKAQSNEEILFGNAKLK